MKPSHVFALLTLSGMVAAFLFPAGSNAQFHPRKDAWSKVGVATVDITPEKPIRLSGYGSRTTPSEGVEQRLEAKALSFQGTSLLLTVDTIGVPAWVTAEVSRQITEKTGVKRENFAICSTHSHTAPTLHRTLPFMFPSGTTEAEREVIREYTDQLIEKLVEVGVQAHGNLAPSRIFWGKGEVTFAVNRRVIENGKWKGFGVQEDGPVDHSFPMMKITAPDGKLRAVFANYACHCTTLGGNFNRVHGDWAGVAREEIESRHPGASALIAIGCGADANPDPRGELDMAIAHGKAVADEVDRLLESKLTPLTASPSGTYREIQLPLEDPPARGVWEEQVRKKLRGHHLAAAMLAKLDRGEPLESEVTYPVQTWTFGDELAMVFLAGEVVVDYAHRFYRTFDAERLWINAYSNDVPCYLPSRRLYGEGGYEVDYSMVYYGKPSRLAADTEDRISDEVLRQMPHSFYSGETKEEFPAPVEKGKAAETIRVPTGFEVELFAAEPHVMDPVDIAWDRHGRLWVVEMADYPTGVEGKPGGRVRILTPSGDSPSQGDLPNPAAGLFRDSIVFLDDLKYPNSVLPWRDGALVVVADQILFARDTDGDGRADETRPVITGFDSGNSQHQLGGLEWGLGNWVHVGNGGSHGSLTSTQTGKSFELGSRDFRFRPDTGEIELLSGEAQYGLTRDDWGNWFACNNSKPWWHYALAGEYLQRNPHIRYPDTKVLLGEEPVAGPVFPASKTVSRFNDYDAANRFTSACGLHLHRDSLPDDSPSPQLYVAEPVHNLVSRLALTPDGATFSGARVSGEEEAEFFASTDNWCRPTSIRTGPDGAIYVVDMYRQVIEHPQWIPELRQRRLNLREGSDRGRIYRITARGREYPMPAPVASLSPEELVDGLDDRNGARRDLIHRELLVRNDPSAAGLLRGKATSAQHPGARAQALAILDDLGVLDETTLLSALSDSHSGVRKNAIRLAEQFPGSDSILEKLTLLADDPDAPVRQQLAYSLGEFPSSSAGSLLGTILTDSSDTHIIQAALSSLAHHLPVVTASAIPHLENLPPETLDGILRSLDGFGDHESLAQLLSAVDSRSTLSQVIRAVRLRSLASSSHPGLKRAVAGLAPLFEEARETLRTEDASLSDRKLAIQVMGGFPGEIEPDLLALVSLLQATQPTELQLAASARLEALGSDEIPGLVFASRESIGASAWSAFLDATSRRTSWTRFLLEEAGGDPAVLRAISPIHRSALLHHRDPDVRETAETVFEAATGSSRKEVLKAFRASLEMEGNPERGKAHFQALCSSCHRTGDTGFHVGPDLSALTNRSREALLPGILDPNAAVEGKYALHVVDLEDGRSLSGVVSSETGTSITLLGAGGVSQTILRNEITSLKNSGLSLMPEGLEAGLDTQGMADLLAFLQASGTDHRVVPDARGAIQLTSKKATASGPFVLLDSSTGAFSRITREDSLSWTLSELPEGRYAIFFHAGLDAEEIPGSETFQLRMGDQTVHGTIEKTGALQRMRKRQFGEVTIPHDCRQTEVVFRHSLPKGRVSIREVVLIPVR